MIFWVDFLKVTRIKLVQCIFTSFALFYLMYWYQVIIKPHEDTVIYNAAVNNRKVHHVRRHARLARRQRHIAHHVVAERERAAAARAERYQRDRRHPRDAVDHVAVELGVHAGVGVQRELEVDEVHAGGVDAQQSVVAEGHQGRGHEDEGGGARHVRDGVALDEVGLGDVPRDHHGIDGVLSPIGNGVVDQYQVGNAGRTDGLVACSNYYVVLDCCCCIV